MVRVFDMNKTLQIGVPPIDVHLRRSALARRYSLKVSNTDGKVSLTLPKRASERGAVSFAKQQEAWLRAALGRLPGFDLPVYGGTISFEGQPVVLRPTTGRRVVVEPGALMIPGKPEELPAKLRGFLKVAARERLAEASHFYAAKVGKPVTRITLRDTKSRWGSCTEAGNLMYSWRLIMAPPEVLRYVAAHEVAHFIEMNHSRDFWQVVRELMPDFECHRAWLKQNGSSLHQVRF